MSEGQHDSDVELFSDGACSGNPGPGGWGVLLRYNDQNETELFGGERDTTNNRMELKAVIEGLNALTKALRVAVFTDSQYVQKGITEWLPAWKARGWKTADHKPVKNVDLWKALEEAAGRHRSVRWRWVRGHDGHAENERADALARKGITELV